MNRATLAWLQRHASEANREQPAGSAHHRRTLPPCPDKLHLLILRGRQCGAPESTRALTLPCFDPGRGGPEREERTERRSLHLHKTKRKKRRGEATYED